MTRAESRSVIVEDSTTGDNQKVHTDGSAQQRIMGANGNALEPNANGSLPVTTVITPPPAATPVVREGFSSTNDTDGIDTIYEITDTKVLKITSLDGGSEINVAGSVVELFEDPNGDLSVLNRISEIYVNGQSDEQSVDENFTGNGTRRIVLRRRAFGGGAREISGRWRGYEE